MFIIIYIQAHKELIEESNTRGTFSLLDNFGIVTKIREVYDIEEF